MQIVQGRKEKVKIVHQQPFHTINNLDYTHYLTQDCTQDEIVGSTLYHSPRTNSHI